MTGPLDGGAIPPTSTHSFYANQELQRVTAENAVTLSFFRQLHIKLLQVIARNCSPQSANVFAILVAEWWQNQVQGLVRMSV